GVLPARRYRVHAGRGRRELRDRAPRSDGCRTPRRGDKHRWLSRARGQHRAARSAWRSDRARERADRPARRRCAAARPGRARTRLRGRVQLERYRASARGNLLRCAEPLMFLVNYLVALAATLVFKIALFVYAASGEGQTSAIAWYPRLALCVGWDVV